MILSKQVMYRGQRIDVSELKPNSEIKVLVQCPKCQQTRKALYKSVKNNQICHSCAMKYSRKIDIPKNKKYNRLRFHTWDNGKYFWKCDCGNITEAQAYNVKRGHTKSCGCLQLEEASRIGKLMTSKWKGEKHPNWQGGISSERQRFNSSKAAKHWRISVFERDGYTCQHCGQVGRELNAHHIYPFALYPKKRLDLDNGLTLCVKCHIGVHKAMGKPKRKTSIIKKLTNESQYNA